jgi:hypothetical protein
MITFIIVLINCINLQKIHYNTYIDLSKNPPILVYKGITMIHASIDEDKLIGIKALDILQGKTSEDESPIMYSNKNAFLEFPENQTVNSEEHKNSDRNNYDLNKIEVPPTPFTIVNDSIVFNKNSNSEKNDSELTDLFYENKLAKLKNNWLDYDPLSFNYGANFGINPNFNQNLLKLDSQLVSQPYITPAQINYLKNYTSSFNNNLAPPLNLFRNGKDIIETNNLTPPLYVVENNNEYITNNQNLINNFGFDSNNYINYLDNKQNFGNQYFW